MTRRYTDRDENSPAGQGGTERRHVGQRFRCGRNRHYVTTSDGRRLYLVHVPKSYDPRRRHPVVVVLHGGGASARFAYRVHGWIALAEREQSLVVFPDGSLEDPQRPASLRDNLRLWNDGSWRSGVAQRNVDDIGFLTTVLDQLEAEYAVDPDRIFVSGFSNGGSMTYRVGVELSHRVAAIAPVAGHLCLADPQPRRAVSLLYIVGLRDPIVPFAGGAIITPWGQRREKPPVMNSINTWIRLVGAAPEPQVTRQQDGIHWQRFGPGDAGREVQLYTIEGQGHEWPGAERTLPESISGPQTDHLDATRVIWEFFSNRSPHRSVTS